MRVSDDRCKLRAALVEIEIATFVKFALIVILFAEKKSST
jgi:hypothetical protein